MLHFFLLFLALQPSTLCNLYAVHRVVPMKQPWLYILCTTICMDLIWFCNQFLLVEPSLLLRFTSLAAGFCLLPFFADRKQILSSLFTYGFMMMVSMLWINFLGNVLFSVCSLTGFPARRLMDLQDPAYLFMTLLMDATLPPLLLLFAAILRRFLDSLSTSRSLAWFLTIPLSQILLMMIINETVDLTSDLLLWGVMLLCGLLCLSADLAALRAYRKLHELELVTARAREAEHQLELQNKYYQELQERILSVNQIRHDLNNQLKTAYYLLEQGHPEEVRAQLDSLKACISQRIGNRYCENLMVDAVLSEKAALCRKLSLPLEISALVPGDLPIESAHLCSAFSNLLDNCIAAAGKAGGGTITLRSDIRNGYLLISCSNPALGPEVKKDEDLLRKHGLGLDILSALAGLYDGSLQTGFSDGIFSATLALKLQAQKKQNSEDTR